MKKLLCLFLLLPLLGTRCEKENELKQSAKKELPEITQEGKATFGCMHKGEVWLPEPLSFFRYGFTSSLACTYYPSDNYYRLWAKKENKNGFIETISFSIENFTPTPKRHQLGMGSQSHAYFSLQKGNGPLTSYQSDSLFFGEIHVAYIDTSKRIVSGTFWFNARSANGDTVSLTDGRFDMLINSSY